jgi:hypothetical protein
MLPPLLIPLLLLLLLQPCAGWRIRLLPLLLLPVLLLTPAPVNMRCCWVRNAAAQLL